MVLNFEPLSNNVTDFARRLDQTYGVDRVLQRAAQEVRSLSTLVDETEETERLLDENTETSSDTARQKISILRSAFVNNTQGLPLNESYPGVITMDTGYNDLDIMGTVFEGNVFNQDAVRTPSSLSFSVFTSRTLSSPSFAVAALSKYGYAIMAMDSTLRITHSNFLLNGFSGMGPVVALGDMEFFVESNFGTVDNETVCEFMAILSGDDEDNTTCVSFDLDSPAVRLLETMFTHLRHVLTIGGKLTTISLPPADNSKRESRRARANELPCSGRANQRTCSGGTNGSTRSARAYRRSDCVAS